MTKNFSLEKLLMTGVDYKNCPVEVRERVSFTHLNLEGAYKKLKSSDLIKEVIILSTCNRSEIYAVTDEPQLAAEFLQGFYSDFFDVTEEEISEYIILRTQKEVVRHIFEVSCGFQSMVLGEDQILCQVKNSYNSALENEATGKFLNRLFIESITSAKKIKNLTGISENQLSVSSIGVKLIEQKLSCLEGKKALVIGLGEMSKIAIQNMYKKNIDKVYVTNRTRRKVTDFAKQFPKVIQIDFKDRYEPLKDADIVISCTSAPHYVLKEEKFRKAYNNQPLYMLDLAIPRDIEPSLSEFEGVEIFRVDDLEKIAQDNVEKRLNAKQEGEKILIEGITKFINWSEETRVVDIIVALKNSSEEMLGKELTELRDKLGEMDEKQLRLIEKSFSSFAKSFLHQPIVKIREFAKDNHACTCDNCTCR